MELLLAAAVTIFTQCYKWLAKKLGYEKAKTLTLVVSFMLSVVSTFVWKYLTHDLDISNADALVSTFGISMAYYEVVVKRVLIPIFTPKSTNGN